MRQMVQELRRSGWVEVRSNKHRVFRHPSGEQITVSRTPNTYGAVLRMRSQMRRVQRAVG